MILSMIAAVANNQVIGNQNQLIWHLPADLKHFKSTTMGHAIIMGRKTFESIGKPLPGRRNIVITNNPKYQAEGCHVAHSLKEAIDLAKGEKEVFVAGGAEIYIQAMDHHLTRRLYVTRIFANFEGDAFFPPIDEDKWKLIEQTQFEADEKNPYPYAFLCYKKKSSCK